MTSSSVEEFEACCVEKKDNGLVDLKFCVTGSLKSTPEAFCAEANSIDRALDCGDFEPLIFNDATGLKA